jgi:hypothetical protein
VRSGQRAGPTGRRRLVFVGIAAAAGAVLVSTWGAVPWVWGFPLFFVGLVLAGRGAERLLSLRAGSLTRPGVIAFSTPFALYWFYGDAWPTAPWHLGSIAVLSILLGSAVVDLIWPPFRPGRFNTPLQPTVGGQIEVE